MPHTRAFADEEFDQDFDTEFHRHDNEDLDPEYDDEDFGSDYYDDDPYDDNDRDLSYARLLNRSGVECRCEKCGTMFTGMPGHGVCSPCADKIEMGVDF